MPVSNRPTGTTATLRQLRVFPDLMRYRVRRILLVASLYDSFILTEDGRLNEALMHQFLDLNLDQNPDLIRVSNGAEALAMLDEDVQFDMVITSLQLGDMNAAELACRVKEAGLGTPVTVLAYSNRDLTDFLSRHPRGDVDRLFLWQGDVRVLLAMVKDLEDRTNVARDTGQLGVPAILVVEDNVRFYSSFLPMMYSELMDYSQRLVSEGLNLTQKMRRLRARPKLLLCESFETAWEYFEKYEENILGVLSDFEFPRDGKLDRRAGEELVSRIHEVRDDIPVVMQSSKPDNEAVASRLNAAFLLKDSPVLLHRLRELLLEKFGFGDFVFRNQSGVEIDRAGDLKTLAEKLQTVSTESLVLHGERNHFSMWLKARSEFELADRLRPRRVSDYESAEHLRDDLLQAIGAYRLARDRAVVADFDRDSYDESVGMARIGTGSLGGKARGLAFVNRLLLDAEVAGHFPGVQIAVPPSVVLGTGVFDEFLEKNRLADLALGATPEEELRRRFAEAPLPREVERDLKAFLRRTPGPLAVRSSGLLEDSPSQPLAGVYRTIMLPNRGRLRQRLADLLEAVKTVYASTFSRDARAFLKMTPFRLEEEKMAVIIQRMVGAAHGERFYPDFSGVARSYNVYPSPPMRVEDGVAAVALGLGRAVVGGDACLRFSPNHPRHILALSDVDTFLKESQREFYALDLSVRPSRVGQDGAELTRYGLDAAEEDGTLVAVGSTYSAENNAIYDGIARPGMRLVSFTPILKHGQFPLAELLAMLLEIGRRGTGSEVEIEFAVNLSVPDGAVREFGFLQMRPLALAVAQDAFEIGEVPPSDLICRSQAVLGHGRLELRDLVVVDPQRFDRLRSIEVAEQVARINVRLQEEGTPYVLIGVGRWGSMDRHLGIPVNWNQIAGARVIVESGFRDLKVTPSQGTHFFQNLTSLNIGYFTVNPQDGEGLVDWDWLAAQPAVEDTGFVRHLRFDDTFCVTMDGRTGAGVILKPRD